MMERAALDARDAGSDRELQNSKTNEEGLNYQKKVSSICCMFRTNSSNPVYFKLVCLAPEQAALQTVPGRHPAEGDKIEDSPQGAERQIRS